MREVIARLVWSRRPRRLERLVAAIGGITLAAVVGGATLASAAQLPTGAMLDPATKASPLGNFPLAIALAPGGDHAAVLLNGWREQGVQILDRSGAITQTLLQPSAFIGLAFSPDGRTLWASGGYEDALYRYRWNEGAAQLEATVPLAAFADKGTFYPAGIAVSPDGKRVYVAENLGDTLSVVDTATNAVVQRVQVDRYPYGVAVSGDGSVFVSSWGDDTVLRFAERDGGLRRVARIVAGRHPSSMLLDDSAHRLSVTCASIDRIKILSTKTNRVVGEFDDTPRGVREGSTPNALAIANRRLFVAEADNNAVAVFDLGTRKLLGRIPTEWYPSALAVAGDDLIIVNAKGGGAGPNPGRTQPLEKLPKTSTAYVLGQLTGSVMRVPVKMTSAQLHSLTSRVTAANRWRTRDAQTLAGAFQHVIYIIKENRTYDQVFGDLPGGDGDPSLVYFPRDVSPNHHALAERFGIFDRFLVNAEVSAQGHNWSTAAYTTDYVEKAMPSEYSSRGRSYDYQGTNRDMIVDEDDDVASPAAGYLWNLALKKKITFRNYGEFVVGGKQGDRTVFVPTRRALRDHTNRDYATFDLTIPDQQRADVWLADLQKWIKTGSMPALQILSLPNDHTAGAKAGAPTPRAYMADNDLALGRMIEALTKSPFWKDTVVFVLEDDAQSGPDHVDSHRSVLLTISAYNRPGVVHRFVNTTDVIATIEEILGLDSMSQFDHYGHPLRGLFAKEADLRAYEMLTPSVDLNEKNPENAPGAKPSARLDFSRPDAIDDAVLNAILWQAIKGDTPMPAAVRRPAGALVE